MRLLGRAVAILDHLGVRFETVDVLQDPEIRQGIKAYSDWPTIPQLYVKGEFVGGSDIMMEMYEAGELQQLFQDKQVARADVAHRRKPDSAGKGRRPRARSAASPSQVPSPRKGRGGRRDRKTAARPWCGSVWTRIEIQDACQSVPIAVFRGLRWFTDLNCLCDL